MLQITRNECPRILQRSKIRELQKETFPNVGRTLGRSTWVEKKTSRA